MRSDVREADIHEVLERHRAQYEARPYYVLLDQCPEVAPPIQQRVQAGFDVDVYDALESDQLPLLGSEGARMGVDYFEAVTRGFQAKVGQRCKIEIIPFTDSLCLDSTQHCRPQMMLRIRLDHGRGLDSPEGPPEEQALVASRETLHEPGG